MIVMERDWSVGADVSEYVNEAPEGTVVANRNGVRYLAVAGGWQSLANPLFPVPRLSVYGPYTVVKSPPEPDRVEADGFVTITVPVGEWDKARAVVEPDPVNHPSHYKHGSKGAEVIDLTEHLDFCRGSAVKYLCRAGRKDPARELEDLRKAAWYVQRSIEKLEREQS